MGKPEVEENEQLVLEETKKEKKPKGEDEGKGKPESKKWVVLILLISVIVSLVFYLTSNKKDLGNKSVNPIFEEEVTPTSNSTKGGGLFGPKVYEY